MSSSPSEMLVEANQHLVLAVLKATEDAEKTARRLREVTLAAHLDPLTGLPDRLLFLDRFAQAIAFARRHRSRLALLFVDLDRFKKINDTRGHAVGDSVLRAAADALHATVREADTVSRHGGDEFLVLLTEVSNPDGAVTIARKLADAIGASPKLAALGVHLSASIGVCVYPDDGVDALTLIAHADSAMYRAKKERSGVAVYSRADEWSPSGQATEFATNIYGSASQPDLRGDSRDEDMLHDLARQGRFPGVVTDIAERRVLADHSRQAQAMETVAQVTSGIARVFDKLLLVLEDSLESLARRIAPDDETRRPLESARKAVQRGARLNRQLLAFSGRQALHPEVLCLDDLVPAFANLLNRAAGEVITVEVRRLAEAWYCQGDRKQLELAVVNLAINGHDAMPDGGVLTLSVVNVTADALLASTWGAKPGDYAAVSVEDTGSGMAADVRTRAFEPFFTTRASGRRSGLGLSQVYGFVKQSGGFVSIDTGPGRGTRVTIHLPRHR